MRYLIFLFALALPAGGWAAVEKPSKGCSTADIHYLGTEKRRGDIVFGLFSMRNTGDVPLRFPINDNRSHVLHYMYAETQIRPRSGVGWTPRTLFLDSWTVSPYELVVDPGEQVVVKVADAGVFRGEDGPGVEYAMLFKDRLFRCEVMSEPFVVLPVKVPESQ